MTVSNSKEKNLSRKIELTGKFGEIVISTDRAIIKIKDNGEISGHTDNRYEIRSMHELFDIHSESDEVYKDETDIQRFMDFVRENKLRHDREKMERKTKKSSSDNLNNTPHLDG